MVWDTFSAAECSSILLLPPPIPSITLGNGNGILNGFNRLEANMPLFETEKNALSTRLADLLYNAALRISASSSSVSFAGFAFMLLAHLAFPIMTGKSSSVMP